MGRVDILILTGVLLLAGCERGARRTQPSPTTTAPAEASEEVVRIPLGAEHPGMTLEGTFFRPAGIGPFPLVIMNHGAIGKRNPDPRWRPHQHAHWFAARGFALLVPMRRGNASSDGDWAEGYGQCSRADYTQANLESASDIRAALDFARRRSDVDRDHVVLHGMSAGGHAVLALAGTAPPGVVGVMSFAGGRGSLSGDGGETRYNCAPDALVAAARGFGQTTKVPTLWLYATNDQYFPPPLARSMFDAFVAAGGKGEFVALPSFMREGHEVTWRPAGVAVWADQVDRFLARLGFAHP